MIESLLPTMEEDGTVNEVKKRFIYIGEDYNDYKNSCYIGLAKTKEKTNVVGEDGQSDDAPVGDEGENQETFEVKSLEEWKNKQEEQQNNEIIKNEESFNNVIMLNANFDDIADKFWEKDTCCFFSLTPFILQSSSIFSMQYKSSGESDGNIILVPYNFISNLSTSEEKAKKIMKLVAPYQNNEEVTIAENEKTYSIPFNNIFTSTFIIQCVLCEDIVFPSGYYIPVLKISVDSSNWAAPELYRFLSIR